VTGSLHRTEPFDLPGRNSTINELKQYFLALSINFAPHLKKPVVKPGSI